MRLRIFATITTLWAGAATLSAQPCDPPAFSFVLNRDTTCVGQPVTALPTGSTAGTLIWNFCDGAVRNGTFERTTILSTSEPTTSFSIVEENGEFWGFYVQGNRLRRVSFGDSPLNPPGEPEVFNVINFPAYSIAPYVQNGNHYLFVTRGIVAPTELYRINFGGSFANNSPSLTTVSTGTSLAFGFQMRFVDDVDGNIKLLIANGAGNNHLAVVNFGADVTNTAPDVWVRPMPYALAGLDVAKTCAGWQVVVGQGSRLTIFNFGDVINPAVQEPVVVGEINNPPGLTLNIRSLKLFAEAGRWYVWLESQGQTNFRSVVLGFNESQISLPFSYAANYPGPSSGYANGMDRRRWNGRNIFWTSDNNGANSAIFRMEFLPACELSEVFDAQVDTYAYLRPGNRTVGAYLLMDNGATATAAQDITVSGALPDFFVGPACLGFATVFDNQSLAFAPDATLWQWDFGDQTSSQERDPVHSYAGAGQYVVTLSAYSPAGCVDEVSRTVSVVPPPAAGFSVQALGTCMSDPYAFSDLSVGNPPVSAWLWDMGDGAVYHTPEVQHRYTAGGSYTVRLVVENEGGCRDTTEQSVNVPGFDFDVTNACIGNETAFAVESFYSPGVVVIGYTWEILTDPPVTYSVESPTHVFTEGGSYDVKLTLRTNSGCTDTLRKTIFVAPPPLAAFSILNRPISGTPVYFINESEAFGAEVTAWHWDFGAPGAADTVSSFNAEYTYAGPGTYVVTLTMQTAAGCRDTATMNVVVCDRSFCNLPAFSLPDTICLENELVFHGPSSHCISKTSWNYCTSVSQNNVEPTFVYDSITGFNASRGMKLVRFQNQWYGFALNSDPQRPLLRLDFGTSLENVPDVVPIPFPQANVLRGPEVFEYNGRWYGFICNTAQLILYRIEFGTDLANPNPTIVNLGSLGLTQSSSFFVAIEPDGRIRGLLSSAQQNSVVIYDLGYDPLNTPIPINVIQVSEAFHSQAFYTCSGWALITTPTTSNRWAIVNYFDESLASAPTSTKIISGASNMFAAPGWIPIYENGNWYLLGQSYTNSRIVRMNVGATLDAIPTNPVTETWNVGGHASKFGFTAVRDQAGKVHCFSFDDIGGTNTPMRRTTFAANCGNGQTLYETEDSLVAVFNSQGTVNLDRCVTYANGRTACYSVPVNVGGTSVAFDFDNPCAGNPVQFTDQSLLSTPGALYQWDFGDQSPGSTLFNPTHTFDVAGSYPVTLTVSDPAGCVNSLTRNVGVKQTPRADFFITPQGGCVGSPVRFSDNSTFADGEIVLRAWDMGDNIQVFDSTEFFYSYAKGGTYRVRLTVYGNNQCSDSKELFFAAPGAYFETTSACARLATRFTAFANYYGDTVSAWKWNFGDPASGAANFASSQSPSHTFALPGDYDVELVVETLNGCRDTIRERVRVGTLPVADFAVVSPLCADAAVRFEDRSTANVAPVVAYRWDFGVPGTDSDTAVVVAPQYVYDTPGDYTVRLTITTTSGCQAVVSRTVSVAPRPTAAIATDTFQCAGIGFVFESDAGDGARIWEFGSEGYFSTLASPFWRYDSAGVYDASLTVLTDAGCLERSEVRMHVLPSPTLNVVASETVGREPFTVAFTVQADDTLYFLLNDTVVSPKLDTTAAGIRFVLTFKASGRDTVVQRLEVFSGKSPCVAYRLVPITVFPPLDSVWDIAVENFAPRVGTDGYLTVVARFRNKGNVPIYFFDAAIQYGGLTVARQIMNEDTLTPGAALERFFNIRLLVNPYLPEKFACVEAALPNGRADSRPEDNLVCKALEESLAVNKVYPNPAQNRLYVSFVSPVSETIPIQAFDPGGRKVFDLPFAAKIGLNETELDLTNVADGMYVLVLTFRNQREKVKFVVDK